jgi:hypothetical protein
LIFTLVDFKTLTYGNYTYPMEATILGFFIALSSVAMVPIVATYKIFQLDGPIAEVYLTVIYAAESDKFKTQFLFL